MIQRPVRAALRALTALCLIATGPVHALNGDGDATVEEVNGCMAANLPDSTSVQLIEFESRDREGNGRELLSRVSWKRFDDGLSKVMIRMYEPPDVRGAGLLMLEKETRADMFLYLPDLRKSRRVSSHMMSGSMFGTDFTYEDFQKIQGMQGKVRSELHEPTEVEGTPVHVVVQYPEPEAESAYERIVSYVDRETCVALKMEMYEPGDKLRKVLTVDPEAVIEQPGARVPREILMNDVKKSTSTRLTIKDIEVDGEISKKVFSQSALERPQSR